MNANGMARGYMAKHMQIDDFIHHITACIKRELEDVNDQLSVALQDSNENYIWELRTTDSTYFALVPKQVAQQLKKQSPYALDRLIWDKLKNVGLIINEDSHYLKTVYKN